MGRRHGKKKDNGKGAAASPNVTETSRIQISKLLEEFRDGYDEGIIQSSSSTLGFFSVSFSFRLSKVSIFKMGFGSINIV